MRWKAGKETEDSSKNTLVPDEIQKTNWWYPSKLHRTRINLCKREKEITNIGEESRDAIE